MAKQVLTSSVTSPAAVETKVEAAKDVVTEPQPQPEVEKVADVAVVAEAEEKVEVPATSPVEEGADVLLKKIESMSTQMAQLQSDRDTLKKQVESKREELNKKHDQLNLEKKSKEDLAKEIVTLRDKVQTQERAAWDRFNKWLPGMAQQVKDFVDVVKTPQMTCDELLTKINDAQAKGLLGTSSKKIDNSFAARPVVQNAPRGRQVLGVDHRSVVSRGVANLKPQ